MTFRLRCVGLVNGRRGPAGQWLEAYDVETGTSDWTLDPDKALTFATFQDAYALWVTVLPSDPVRPWDGRPNRPLTAFTVEIDQA